jgi:uncharacterized protein (TIGR03000 family)
MTRLTPLTRIVFGLMVAAALVSPGTAGAQAVGVGVGVGGPRPVGVYGGYGFAGIYGGAYPGFWSNGYSLYGPPVPTYGSVPGYFGGADQRLSNFNAPNIFIQNGADIGLGGPGSGGAGPRRLHWAGSDAAAGQQVATGQATIDVRVPAADAEVLFEGNNTRQAGVRRLFQSPVIQAGPTYFYKVRAKWKQPDGSVADQERSVAVRAGETTVVDFTPSIKIADKAPLLGAP